MKAKRQGLILELIKQEKIETQEALLQALSLRGLCTTQATISRDIRQLHLVKEHLADGSHRYVAPERREEEDSSERLRKLFREGVNSCDVAQNLLVLKTMPGMASAACLALDNMSIPALVGTLAGDDTALLIMRSNAAAEEFYHEVSRMLIQGR